MDPGPTHQTQMHVLGCLNGWESKPDPGQRTYYSYPWSLKWNVGWVLLTWNNSPCGKWTTHFLHFWLYFRLSILNQFIWMVRIICWCWFLGGCDLVYVYKWVSSVVHLDMTPNHQPNWNQTRLKAQEQYYIIICHKHYILVYYYTLDVVHSWLYWY